MRLGLVTDIHGRAEELARALDLFSAAGVEQVVCLGDAFDAFGFHERELEIATLLTDCGAIGVWGNHDFGLCHDTSGRQQARFGPAYEYLAKARPTLEVGGCHFSHKEANVDPHDVLELWAPEEEPLDLLSRATASLTATDHDRQFVGHHHRWWAATARGQVDWDGSCPLILEPLERYFVVVAPVFQGWCALLDTRSGLLKPMRCGDS